MIRPFIVREEGGLIEHLGLVAWLLSDGPFFGFDIGPWRFVHDPILTRYGYQPWRASRPYNPHP